MDKEIICVYQDCVMCGDKGKELIKYIETNGLQVRKVSFASDEGKELVHEAVFNHKISKMTFFTDGKKYTEKISEFVEKKGKKARVGKNGNTK